MSAGMRASGITGRGKTADIPGRKDNFFFYFSKSVKNLQKPLAKNEKDAIMRNVKYLQKK